ncbi:MAG TPA: MFS transporter, partial [Chloroflexota bacterium]|nr:MFS transporter [Chloroflexota bacterium]
MVSSPRPRPWLVRLPFYYGWVIVAVGFIASAFSIGLTWTAGLLAVPMAAELEWSGSAFFFAVSLRGWLGIVFTPIMGPYLDRPRGPRVLVLIGGLVNAVGVLLIPFVDSAWQFVVLFGVLGGIAQAAQTGISAAIVPKWFVRQRGMAVAVSTMGGGLTAVFLPPVVGVMTGASGWRSIWLVIGLLALVFGTLSALLLYREPEDLGLAPDGRTPGSERGVTPAGSIAEERSFTRTEALHTSVFWVLLVGIAVGSLANNGIPAMLAPIFVDRGFPFDVSAHSLAWYGVASTITKFAWGWAANRFSVRAVLLILTFFGALALPSVLIFPLVGPGLYAFLIGVYIGAYFFLSQM